MDTHSGEGPDRALLIVEDLREWLWYLERDTVAAVGDRYAILEARDVPAAEEALRSHGDSISLIVLDPGLPTDVDVGLELAGRIRRGEFGPNLADVPMLCITVEDTPRVEQLVSQLEMRLIRRRPVYNSDVFINAVRELLGVSDATLPAPEPQASPPGRESEIVSELMAAQNPQVGIASAAGKVMELAGAEDVYAAMISERTGPQVLLQSHDEPPPPDSVSEALQGADFGGLNGWQLWGFEVRNYGRVVVALRFSTSVIADGAQSAVRDMIHLIRSNAERKIDLNIGPRGM